MLMNGGCDLSFEGCVWFIFFYLNKRFSVILMFEVDSFFVIVMWFIDEENYY